MKLIPVGSFIQDENEVIKLLKRKLKRGKLSLIGKEFINESKKRPSKR